MIVLFTDFGTRGPYVGQMQAVLVQQAPGIPIIDLFSDAPGFDPRSAAYLLAAYVEEFPLGTVFLCVVDPGVGSAVRKPVMVEIDGRWFVGPDNGLFEVVAQRGNAVRWHEITWRPAKLSASFHGRDLFAPVAAQLARGEMPDHETLEQRAVYAGPEDLAQIIYLDAFGNAMTGLRTSMLTSQSCLLVRGQVLWRARTFSDVAPGEAFWYENANGLAEIAINQGSACSQLGLKLGDEVAVRELP